VKNQYSDGEKINHCIERNFPISYQQTYSASYVFSSVEIDEFEEETLFTVYTDTVF
jgi:hypothetical protein